jgi:hypothetical protein
MISLIISSGFWWRGNYPSLRIAGLALERA